MNRTMCPHKQPPFQYLLHSLTGDHVSVDGIASGVRASAVRTADRARGPWRGPHVVCGCTEVRPHLVYRRLATTLATHIR